MTVYVEFQDDRIVEMKTSQQFVVKYKSHENSGVLEDVNLYSLVVALLLGCQRMRMKQGGR